MGGIVAAAAGPVAAQAADPDPTWPGPLVFSGVLLVAAGCLAVLWKLDAIRPGSLRRAGREPPPAGAAIPLALSAFGVYLLPSILALAVLAAIGFAFSEEPGLREVGLIALLSYGGGVGVAALACWLALRSEWLRPGAVLPRARDLWIGVVALALTYPVLWVVSQAARAAVVVSGGDPGPTLQHGTLELLTAGDRASPWWWAVLAGAVLGAPIVEEVVFRGLLQPALRAVMGPWPAVLIAGGLFALLHVPRGPESGGATWLAIPTLAALALALGIARERTGRLGVPIAMHIAFNALNVALAFAATRG